MRPFLEPNHTSPDPILTFPRLTQLSLTIKCQQKNYLQLSQSLEIIYKTSTEVLESCDGTIVIREVRESGSQRVRESGSQGDR